MGKAQSYMIMDGQLKLGKYSDILGHNDIGDKGIKQICALKTCGIRRMYICTDGLN